MQSPFAQRGFTNAGLAHPDAMVMNVGGQTKQYANMANAQKRIADAEAVLRSRDRDMQNRHLLSMSPGAFKGLTGETYKSLHGGEFDTTDFATQQSEAQLERDLAQNAMLANRSVNSSIGGLRRRYQGAVDEANIANILGYAGAAERQQMNANRAQQSSALGQTLQVLRALLDPAASMTPGNQSLLASLMGPDTNIDFRGNQNQQIGGMTASARPVSSMYRYNW